MPQTSESTHGMSYRTKALIFAGGLVVGLLAGEFVRLPKAQAQIPDPAAQRMAAQKASSQTNLLLKEMIKVLRTETLKVEVVGSDKPKRSRTIRPSSKR